MDFLVKSGALHAARAEALVAAVPAIKAKPTGEVAMLDRSLKGALAEAMSLGDFKGSAGQVVWIPARRLAAKRVLLVGLGPDAKVDSEDLRAAFGVAGGALRRARVKSIVCVLPRLGGLDAPASTTSLVEGLVLGTFDPGAFKTQERKAADAGLARVTLVCGPGDDKAAIERAVTRGKAFAAGTLLARDLGNRPANVLPPAELAAEAMKLAARYKSTVRCTVWGPRELAKHGMGGILGVGQGSAQPPRFIQLEYRPKDQVGSLPKIAFVGKGITFDSGGISIKPAASMDLMKMDMCGAAAVLGAFEILGTLQPQVHVLGYVASAENMPSGTATKPGDLLRMMNGMTVEVNNTDAEGRLVLADALHFAKQQEPAFIVDLATLTGACQIALGDAASGLMSEDDELVALLEKSARQVDEPVWRLPLNETHRKRMEGHVADLKNTGAREAGALTAAGFLSYFAMGARWAHLDIAGMAWVEENRPYQPKGATGYGARLLAAVAQAVADGDWKAPVKRGARKAPVKRAARRARAASGRGRRATRR